MNSNLFSFKGRIRRSEYWLIQLIIYVMFYFMIVGVAHRIISIPFFYILMIPILWIILAQNTKRCHDRGNSGLFQIVPFYYFVLLFGDSDYGFNEYGPNPKDIGNEDKNPQFGKEALELSEYEKLYKNGYISKDEFLKLKSELIEKMKV